MGARRIPVELEPVTADPYGRVLADLLEFVRDEQEAGERRLSGLWKRPIAEKLETGWTQRFLRLERADDQLLWAYVDGGDSRFREGDMLVLHGGDPWGDLLGRSLTLESEEEDRWLLGGRNVDAAIRAWDGGPCFADVDAIDLTAHYVQTIEEIGASPIGREIVLPLLNGDLEITFNTADEKEGRQRAVRDRRFNPAQADAVGLAFGAEQLAGIQGPPGTGKSAVLAFIARLLVERGERVLVTSHTHMAINNSLNKIRQEGVPTVKIGSPVHRRGLDEEVLCRDSLAAWHDRPTDGYVIGATPFATCSFRLEACEFDAILFDEASQITVPLALMAMRKGKRFIFVGDRKQLPPVMLSRSVLDKDSMSAFAALTSGDADHTVMLEETYRMNQWLTAWPSKMYYCDRLRAAGGNRDRRLSLRQVPERMHAVFDPAIPGVFIPTLDRSARAQNPRDGQLVAELCAAAVTGGVPAREIGVITPYRAQGRVVRNLLRATLGPAAARDVVVDTVERMQGQEREIVILSLATGDEVFLRAVAEFFFQPQRLNVSITRAKSKLIVIGPELTAPPAIGQEQIERWIGEYIQLTQHLTRLTL
jgi:DNA replication ATP-dependent helicase Dna2